MVWSGEKEGMKRRVMQTGGEMKSAVRVLVGEESLGIAVNRLKGGCVKR